MVEQNIIVIEVLSNLCVIAVGILLYTYHSKYLRLAKILFYTSIVNCMVFIYTYDFNIFLFAVFFLLISFYIRS